MRSWRRRSSGRTGALLVGLLAASLLAACGGADDGRTRLTFVLFGDPVETAGYRTLVHAWGGVSTALARLRSRSTREGTRVHPADLDDALCAGAVVASSGPNGRDETRLPFAVDDARVDGAGGALWAVRAARRPNHRLTRRADGCFVA